MDESAEREIYTQHETLKGKFVFFLLAAAGACIALCVRRTTGMSIQAPMILIALAVTCWGLSFFGGCRVLSHQLTAMSGNLEFLQILKGRHPGVGTNPENIEWAKKELRTILEKRANVPGFWWKFQFRFLLLGAVLFIAWHVTDMALGGSSG